MIRKSVTAGVVVASLGLTGAAVGASVAASSSKQHTLTFTSKQTYEKDFAHHNFTDTDKDLQHGKVVGADVVTGHIATAQERVTGFASFALQGGMLHCRFTIDFKTGALDGKITGGAGKFAGAHGTLTGVPSDKSGNDYRITAKYES